MIIRCRSKSNLDRYHPMTVTGPGQVRCCGEAGSFCSHVDAVFNYGLLPVVHPDDQHLVPEARKMVGTVTPPQGWRASWMKDGTWINGRTSRTARPSGAGYVRLPTDRPGVCFSGADPARSRKELAAEANAHGWTHTPDVTSLTQILVLADRSSGARKARKAVQEGIPICDYDEWRDELMSPSWTRG